MDEAVLKENLHKVFKKRNTHGLPIMLPLPPYEWKTKFDLLAKECGMNEPLDQAVKKIREFYQNVMKMTSLNSMLIP